jgi:NAD kinase
MSAGGPISLNEVGSIIMTSLAPFSLSFRPIVWPQCS